MDFTFALPGFLVACLYAMSRVCVQKGRYVCRIAKPSAHVARRLDGKTEAQVSACAPEGANFTNKQENIHNKTSKVINVIIKYKEMLYVHVYI